MSALYLKYTVTQSISEGTGNSATETRGIEQIPNPSHRDSSVADHCADDGSAYRDYFAR